MIKVLCHGCFDILHYGHLLHFIEAKKLGDRLIVSLTADRFFPNKGEGRPVFDENQRMTMVSSLRMVDDVLLSYEYTGTYAIRIVQPTYYVKGVDWMDKGINLAERAECKRHGVIVAYTRSDKYSSADLVRYFK